MVKKKKKEGETLILTHTKRTLKALKTNIHNNDRMVVCCRALHFDARAHDVNHLLLFHNKNELS
jgi:hypothetical protein